METTEMGRVVVPTKIENLADLLEARGGRRAEGDVRRVEIRDALVDTGATNVALPRRLIQQLGLECWTKRPVRTATGSHEVNIYDAVRLTIQGRDCVVDVSELPDDCPVLIGQVPLELMDWVVDPKGQRLIGNPEHGGQWMLDQF